MAQLKKATMLANRRGSKLISIVDVVFQIRHNTAKVSRLKSFLSWKDVRKNVKDSDDKGGGDGDAIDLEEVSLHCCVELVLTPAGPKSLWHELISSSDDECQQQKGQARAAMGSPVLLFRTSTRTRR
jgi:hypothetical protein